MSKKKMALAAAALLFVALVIFAFLIPPQFNFEAKVDIIAQQRMVFVFIGELKRWPEWTKWAARDSAMKNEYSEPSWGTGATSAWKSFWNGDGSLKVNQFIPDTQMDYEVSSDGYEPSSWQIKLGPAPRQGTTVTWTVNGKYPEHRLRRLVAYIMMWTLPADIQKGLDRLKKHAELHEAYDVRGGWEAPPPVAQPTPAPTPMLTTPKSAKVK